MLWNFLKYHTNDSLPLLLSCSRLVPSFQYPTFYFSLLLFPPIYFSFFFFTSVSFPTLSFFIHVFFSSFPFLRFPYLFSLPFHTCFCNSCFTLELVADLSNFSACSLDNQRILTWHIIYICTAFVSYVLKSVVLKVVTIQLNTNRIPFQIFGWSNFIFIGY
jgi:hypothetical protein